MKSIGSFSVFENTNKASYLWLGIAFVVSFFVVGIPYWQIPYSKVSLPSTLYGMELLVVALAAASTRIFGRAHFIASAVVAGVAVPTAVLARVFVETSVDPTSHNLWPFELIIALMVGLFCSLAGALAGSAVSFFAREKMNLKDQ